MSGVEKELSVDRSKNELKMSLSKDTMVKETPMMRQYHDIKKKYKDSILLFRLGDFYEMFEEDAKTASSILNITLTRRNEVIMCGFPYHASDTYISKLLRAGKKIAICEQVEDPKLAKGIVKRDVVEVLSPGMITRSELLESNDRNSIMSLFIDKGSNSKGNIGIAICDVSTGFFYSRNIDSAEPLDEVLNEIESQGVKEIIVPELEIKDGSKYSQLIEKIKTSCDIGLVGVPDYIFSIDFCSDVLKEHFGVSSLEVFEFDSSTELISSGVLLNYIRENVGKTLKHIRWIERARNLDFLIMDNSTKRHLELTENQIDGGKNATLYSVLDNTKTAMGSRLLKWCILNPITDIASLKERLDRTGVFFSDLSLLNQIRDILSGVLDIERIVSKISIGKANARDLIGLRSSLEKVEELYTVMRNIDTFKDLLNKRFEFKKLINLIDSAISDDPPVSVKDGNIIKNGFDKKLDEYRRIRLENREWIKNYQNAERERLGIQNLRVRYNKVIGYYIEVTKANLSKVPDNYIRKQTLVNSERFTTEELEIHEAKLLEAIEKSNELEFEIFTNVCNSILEYIDDLYKIAESVSWIDFHQSLAISAINNNYVKPELTDENIINIESGRHPVIELFSGVDFIENDLLLNDTDRRIMILTGPNMAGKSTFLRQNALIILMAHIGSYVPAKRAEIGIVDRIFSRIGMSDRLVKGESTFLVEMIETSRILHYATNRSFVIMDEIGRGTSTFDGLSIAWAVLEYLLSEKLVGCKAIFATHYHEITAMDRNYGIVNYNVTVKEWNNNVIFLRKVVPGCASKSYGVEVARMAGLPERVIQRAKEILSKLESEHSSYMSLLVKDGVVNAPPRIEGNPNSSEGTQLELFPSPLEIVINELKKVDVNSITPLEALNIIDRLKRDLEL